jgi:ankyrin repeat protein
MSHYCPELVKLITLPTEYGDINFQILIRLSDPVLRAFCLSNKYFASIYAGNELWRLKLGLLLDYEFAPISKERVDYRTVFKDFAETESRLITAASHGFNDLVLRYVVESDDRDKDDALVSAAIYGNTETVRLLLDRGVDIHAGNDLALRRAADSGHTETARLLLDRGADIHARNDCAFRWAVDKDHTQTVLLLLDRGADIHAIGDHALRLAANRGNTEMVQLLLDRGADIHANDDALRWAAENGHTETVRLLVSYYTEKELSLLPAEMTSLLANINSNDHDTMQSVNRTTDA